MVAMRSRSATSVAVAAAAGVLFVFGTSTRFNFVSPGGAHEPKQLEMLSRSLRGKAQQAAPSTEAEAASANIGTQFAAGVAAFAMVAGMLAGASPSQAFFGTGNSGEIIGEIEASGLIFKDTINVERITDPKVQGVTLYQTDFSKSSFDKLKSGNLLQADPSAAGLACSVSGKVTAQAGISKDKKGEEIFSESKAFIGKTLKVKRVFDEKSMNIVYIVYTERMNKDDDPNGSRFKSQACAVHVDAIQ